MRRAAMLEARLRGVLDMPAVATPKDRILEGAFWGARPSPTSLAPVAPLWPRARDRVSRPID